MTVGQILQNLPDNSLITWCEGYFKRDDDTEDIVGFAEDEEACFENVILKKFLINRADPDNIKQKNYIVYSLPCGRE